MSREPTLPAKLAAEFVGTFAVTFTACSNAVAGNPFGPLSVAGALCVCTYALGSISGGHFNPCISFAVLLAWCLGSDVDVDGGLVSLYVAVQFASGVAGGVSAGALWGSDVWGPSSTFSGTARTVEEGAAFPSAVPLGSPGGYGSGRVFWSEAAFSSILILVFLSVFTCGDHGKRERNTYGATAVGGALLAGGAAVGRISGGLLNPAVSFGVAMGAVPFAGVSLKQSLRAFALFASAEFLGCLVAVVLFMGLRKHMLDGLDADSESPFSRFLAEFIGTAAVVLTAGLSAAQLEQPSMVNHAGVAAALMAMTYSMAKVSGGHLNPAVSLGHLLAGRLRPRECASHVGAQLAGGLAAIGTAASVQRGRWQIALVAYRGQWSDVKATVGNGSWGAIAGAEIFYTFLYVFVALNAMIRDAPNQYYGIAISAVVLVGGVAAGSISGGCFNPAVALSLDFGGLFGASGARYGAGFMYAVFECAGALLAACVYWCTRKTRIADEYLHPSQSDDEVEDAQVLTAQVPLRKVAF